MLIGGVTPHVCTAMFDCEATIDGAEEGQMQVRSYMVVYGQLVLHDVLTHRAITL